MTERVPVHLDNNRGSYGTVMFWCGDEATPSQQRHGLKAFTSKEADATCDECKTRHAVSRAVHLADPLEDDSDYGRSPACGAYCHWWDAGAVDDVERVTCDACLTAAARALNEKINAINARAAARKDPK